MGGKRRHPDATVVGEDNDGLQRTLSAPTPSKHQHPKSDSSNQRQARPGSSPSAGEPNGYLHVIHADASREIVTLRFTLLGFDAASAFDAAEASIDAAALLYSLRTAWVDGHDRSTWRGVGACCLTGCGPAGRLGQIIGIELEQTVIGPDLKQTVRPRGQFCQRRPMVGVLRAGQLSAGYSLRGYQAISYNPQRPCFG